MDAIVTLLPIKNISLCFMLLVHSSAVCSFMRNSVNWQAEQAYHAGDIQTAKKLWQDAVLADSNDAKAFYNLGKLDYQEENYENAAQLFGLAAEKATELTQKEQAYFNQGDSFLKQTSYDAAMKAYEKVLQLNAKNQYAQERLEIARRLHEQKRQQQKAQNNAEKPQEESENDQDNQQQSSPDSQPNTTQNTSNERQQNQESTGKDSESPDTDSNAPNNSESSNSQTNNSQSSDQGSNDQRSSNDSHSDDQHSSGEPQDSEQQASQSKTNQPTTSRSKTEQQQRESAGKPGQPTDEQQQGEDQDHDQQKNKGSEQDKGGKEDANQQLKKLGDRQQDSSQHTSPQRDNIMTQKNIDQHEKKHNEDALQKQDLQPYKRAPRKATAVSQERSSLMPGAAAESLNDKEWDLLNKVEQLDGQAYHAFMQDALDQQSSEYDEKNW